jgi:hypothetical protein
MGAAWVGVAVLALCASAGLVAGHGAASGRVFGASAYEEVLEVERNPLAILFRSVEHMARRGDAAAVQLLRLANSTREIYTPGTEVSSYNYSADPGTGACGRCCLGREDSL